MKYHPDKNKHPKSEEIFKKISAAFKILTTPEKRRIYDQDPSCNIFDNQQRSTSSSYRQFYGGGDIFEAEDIFDLFFNIHRNNQRQRYRRQRRPRQGQAQKEQTPAELFMGFLPLLIPLLFSLIFFSSGSVQYFSFNKSREFYNGIKTRRYKIDIFVNKEYINLNYQEKLKVHNEAERNYFNNVKQNCQSEYWTYYHQRVKDPYSGVYCQEYRRLQTYGY